MHYELFLFPLNFHHAVFDVFDSLEGEACGFVYFKPSLGHVGHDWVSHGRIAAAGQSVSDIFRVLHDDFSCVAAFFGKFRVHSL